MEGKSDPKRPSSDASKASLPTASSPLSNTQADPSQQSKSPPRRPRSSQRVQKQTSQPSHTSKQSTRSHSHIKPELTGSEVAEDSEMPSARSQSFSDTNDMPSLTPTTRRISRAKKGKRVHNCDQCDKIFTRAEHLRRHQHNHSAEARYRCKVANCTKTFQRLDLLQRHHERHELQDIGVPGHGPSADHSSPPYSAPQTPPLVARSVRANSGGTPSTMTSGTPTTHYALQPQVYTPYLLQVAIPSTSTHYSPPEPSLGTDESPIYSSNSSCVSADPEHHKAHLSVPPTYLPVSRRRADSTMSAPEQWTQNPKSPFMNGSQMTVWNVEDPFHQQPQLYGSGQFEGSLLQSVGIPAPSLLSQQRAQSFPAPTIRVPQPDGDGGTFYELQYLMLGVTEISFDPRGTATRVMSSVEGLLELFWQHFDPLIPIVHRPSFDWKATPAILVAAMATIGAQYANMETRNLAVDVHRRCKDQLSERYPQASINSRAPLVDIQAVVLLEMFGLFRSKRIDVHLSPQFQALYHCFVQNNTHGTPHPIKSSAILGNQYTLPDLEVEWERWVELESKRRIVLAVFLADIQRMALFQQTATPQTGALARVELPLPSSPALWQCDSGSAWKYHLQEHGFSERRLSDLAFSVIRRTGSFAPLSTFEVSLILAFAMVVPQPAETSESLQACLQYFGSINPTPDFNHSITHHAYELTLYTPLCELLAVTGESWVLGTKLHHHSDFVNAKKKLSAWVRSADAFTAVGHAGHVLHAALSSAGRNDVLKEGLHAQWAVYVAALVCWAYTSSHRALGDDGGYATGGSDEELWASLWRYLGLDGPPSKGTSFLLYQVRELIKGSCSGLLKEAEEVLIKLVESRVTL
ncbi:MAG: hypothetical protein M1833_005268 [Piccolia ochrophora]|nr:MAG: hypothetical protein M1833_005268 [Piccolia ochrophora]